MQFHLTNIDSIIVAPSLGILSIIFLCWILTITVALTFFISKVIALRKHIRDASFLKHISLNGKHIPVYISDTITEPFVIGWMRHKIVLPRWAYGLKEESQNVNDTFPIY